MVAPVRRSTAVFEEAPQEKRVWRWSEVPALVKSMSVKLLKVADGDAVDDELPNGGDGGLRVETSLLRDAFEAAMDCFGHLALEDVRLEVRRQAAALIQRAWLRKAGGRPLPKKRAAGMGGYGKFGGNIKQMITGEPKQAALGLHYLLGVREAETAPMMVDPVQSIREEFLRHGTADDRWCLEYVLSSSAGATDREWPNGAGRERPQ